MRKSVVFFVIMSLILGTGYLVALGSPPDPGWINREVGSASGTLSTLTCYTFVSANYRNDAGNPNRNEYYSYHWAHVEGPSEKAFNLEFKHDPGADPEDTVFRVEGNGVFEMDDALITIDELPGRTRYPYTAVRPALVQDGGDGGTGEVKASVSITIP